MSLMLQYIKLTIRLVLKNIQKGTIQNRKWRMLLKVEDVPRSH